METKKRSAPIKNKQIVNKIEDLDGNEEKNEEIKRNLDDIRLIVGSYEHTIFGLELTSSEIDISSKKQKISDETEEISVDIEHSKSSLNLLFMDAGHDGCIKALTSAGNYLASSSTDETIRLYNLSSKKQIGTLLSSTAKGGGFISCMKFFGDSHLIAGSSNGIISIWKAKDWTLLTALPGHKDAVNSLDIHSSGRIAYSVSKDKTFRMWNLMKGKCIFNTPLSSEGEVIQLSPDDSQYAISSDKKVDIYSSESGEKQRMIESEFKVISIAYLKNGTLLLAGESNHITFWNSEGDMIQDVVSKSTRLKGLCVLNEDHFASISSSGLIQVWDTKKKPKVIAEHETSARLTCVTSSVM